MPPTNPMTPQRLLDIADHFDRGIYTAEIDMCNELRAYADQLERNAAKIAELEQRIHDYEYEPNGQVRANLSNSAVQSILDKAAEFKRHLDAIAEALEWIAKAGERQNALMRRNNLVIDKWPIMDGRVTGPIVVDGHSDTDLSKCTPEERWQAVAFTLHTNLWEVAEKANHALTDWQEIDQARANAKEGA